jgi:Zn-finger nucleic acid-binding protein
MRNQEDVAAMQCPVCRVPLSMSDRQGIEIDYCPQCRGVWLDRGELDKIIERSAPPAASAPAPVAPLSAQREASAWSGHDRDDYRRGHHKPYKRRKSFLEELFD